MSTERYIVEIAGRRQTVAITPRGERWEIAADGEILLIEQAVIEKDRRFSLIVGDHSFLVDLVEKDWRTGRFAVNVMAEQIEVRVRSELEAVAEEVTAIHRAEGVFELKAPMPGIVVRALAAPGDRIEHGQGLIILEAMKMQNELASGMDGIVQEILVKDGQIVETGALLARIIQGEG